MLERINDTKDLKKLDGLELIELANDIRQVLIAKVTAAGGHMGPNLGMVEATIALHDVFNSPKDQIVFDVSHQSYIHKILTGRKEGFIDPDKYDSLSGFTTPSESAHDLFKIGHTSTSLSLACGLAKARDLKGEKENVIVVIGDGSLSGGEAFEGLNNIAMLNSNFIVIFNDNEMSIAENQGGMYKNLRELRETKGQSANNFFKSMGLDYLYVEDGNDIGKLVETFGKVKDIDHPIVVHIHTLKGKGLKWAEENQETAHYMMPAAFYDPNRPKKETYTSLTADFLLQKIKEDSSIVVISPATAGATGLTPEFRKAAGKQYVDVGIAEEHAVAFASGLAKNGAKPVLQVYSTFLQRTYDQLNQDLAMNDNPATILVFSAQISGGDCTHTGMFDIGMTANIPNLICLAPTNKEEYLAMLDWSLAQRKHPVIIRVPIAVTTSSVPVDFTDENFNKSVITNKGDTLAILGLGSFYPLAERLRAKLVEEGFNPTLVNPRIYSELDKELLNNLAENHRLVVTLEDGVLDGGFGYRVANFFGTSKVKVLSFGAQKNYNDLVPLKKIYEMNHLNVEQMVVDIKETLK